MQRTRAVAHQIEQTLTLHRLLSDLAIFTTSASLSFTVAVARRGVPSRANIVYLTDSDSMTQRNAGFVPHFTTHRWGRRLFSSLLPGSRGDASLFRSAIG